MRTTIVALIIGMMFSTGSLFAQEYGGKGEKVHHNPEQVTEKMSKKLNLDKDQKNRVLEINQRYHKQMEEQRERTREEKQQLRQSHQAEIKAVLTPEQQVEYEKMQKKAAQKLRKVQRNQ